MQTDAACDERMEKITGIVVCGQGSWWKEIKGEGGKRVRRGGRCFLRNIDSRLSYRGRKGHFILRLYIKYPVASITYSRSHAWTGSTFFSI